MFYDFSVLCGQRNGVIIHRGIKHAKILSTHLQQFVESNGRKPQNLLEATLKSHSPKKIRSRGEVAIVYSIGNQNENAFAGMKRIFMENIGLRSRCKVATGFLLRPYFGVTKELTVSSGGRS